MSDKNNGNENNLNLLNDNIRWLPNAIEFDYDTFVIVYDNGEWYATHWDEDAFDEDIILKNNEIEFHEQTLFEERFISNDEFNRLQDMVTELNR